MKEGPVNTPRIPAILKAKSPANCAVGIPEDCAKGCEQPTPVLPGVEEAKRGRFAYLD